MIDDFNHCNNLKHWLKCQLDSSQLLPIQCLSWVVTENNEWEKNLFASEVQINRTGFFPRVISRISLNNDRNVKTS